MNNIQPTKFKNIGELLDFLPEEEHRIMTLLRNIILECMPECEERLSYNVPFYYRYSRVCYIWPASIPWGRVDSGVAIGFCRGTRLSDRINYLQKANRKQVCTKTFYSVEQIEPDLLKSYVYEAIEIDETNHKA